MPSTGAWPCFLPPHMRESPVFLIFFLLFLLPLSSFINSSSRNYGGRLQLPPHPGPGPALHSHAHLMRRSHLGQVMVRKVGERGKMLVFLEHHDSAHQMTFILRLQSCFQPKTTVGHPEGPESLPKGFPGDHRHPERAPNRLLALTEDTSGLYCPHGGQVSKG